MEWVKAVPRICWLAALCSKWRVIFYSSPWKHLWSSRPWQWKKLSLYQDWVADWQVLKVNSNPSSSRLRILFWTWCSPEEWPLTLRLSQAWSFLHGSLPRWCLSLSIRHHPTLFGTCLSCFQLLPPLATLAVSSFQVQLVVQSSLWLWLGWVESCSSSLSFSFVSWRHTECWSSAWQSRSHRFKQLGCFDGALQYHQRHSCRWRPPN